MGNRYETGSQLKEQKKIVAKIGTDTLLREGRIDEAFVADFAEQVWQVRDLGRPVALVSSGREALGGQAGLTSAWAGAFAEHGIDTREELFREDSFGRHLKVVRDVMDDGILPIINGDAAKYLGRRTRNNDYLAAHIALGIGADVALLTTENGILDADRSVIRLLSRDTSVTYWEQSRNGTGGMSEKVDAAWLAAEAGHNVIIGNGRQEGILIDFAQEKKDLVATKIAA